MIVKELFVKLGLDVDAASFAEGSLAAEALSKGLEAIVDIAQEVARGFVEMFAKTTEYAGQINDMSASIGVGTDALQELRYAAKLNGLGFEEVSQGVRFLSRNMAEAAAGSDEAAKAFRGLGVRVTDADGRLRPVNDVMNDVADKLAAMPDGAKKTQLAMSAFGRSGARLIPMLNEGGAGLQGMRDEAHDLGVVLDKETIKSGDEFGDNLDRLKFAGEGLKNQIAGPMLRVLNQLAVKLLGWVKNNRVLISQVAGGFVRALTAGAKAIGWMMDNLRVLAAVLVSVVGAALATTAAAFWATATAAVSAAASAIAAWLAAAAPLAIVALGLFLIYAFLEDLWYSLTGGEGILADFWAALMDTDAVAWVKDVFGSIRDFFTWLGGIGLSGIFSNAWTAWKTGFFEFFSWLGSKIKSIPGVGWALDKLSGGGSATAAATGTTTAASFFGGGSSPAASAAMTSSSKSLVFQPQVSQSFAITQLPGESGSDFAKRVAAQSDDTFQRQLNEAHAAVRP